MPKLFDTQAILLTTAANRDNTSLLPLPDKVAPSGAPKALAALLKHGLAKERETNDTTAVHRTDGNLRYSLFATTAGLAAIGIETGNTVAVSPPRQNRAPSKPPRCSRCCSARRAQPSQS